MISRALSLPPSLDELLETATGAAREAGSLQLNLWRGSLDVAKALDHDVKLEADRLSEELILARIGRDCPGSSVFAEEGGGKPGDGPVSWFVDPLDGTMNYFHGQRHFCSSVACYEKRQSLPCDACASKLGDPLAGAVFAAAYGELFSAKSGDGAFCDGVRLRVSTGSLSKALVATSFGSSPETLERMGRLIPALSKKAWKLRMQGSCALDICGVAAGRLAALYQQDVRSWDFAAARIVLEEAGGRFEAEEFSPGRWNVLAAAPGVFEELKWLIAGILQP